MTKIFTKIYHFSFGKCTARSSYKIAHHIDSIDKINKVALTIVN